MVRLFAAIEIPEQMRVRLSLMQGGVPGASWSKTENLHLTLRFIGEVGEVMAGDIDDALGSLRAQSFDVTLKGAGEFGGREPHALWVGAAPCEGLMRLVTKIEHALQRLGLEAETRKYFPHVTLASLKKAPVANVREFVMHHALFDSGVFSVRSFALFSSHKSAKGSLYRPENTYPLDS